MKKRSAEILQRLLNHPQKSLSLDWLSLEYGISEKTIKTDIREILDFMNETDSGRSILYDGRNLSLDNKADTGILREKFYGMDPYIYKMSPEERKTYIILELLYHKGYHSMQQFADELFVTRNTIINDCKLVEEYVEKYGDVFEAKSKRGIRIEISENIKEEILTDLFCEMISSYEESEKFFVHYMIDKAGFVIPLKDILDDMNEYIRQQKFTFAGEVLFQISLIVFIVLNLKKRMGKWTEPEANETAYRQLDRMGKMICYEAEKRNIEFFDAKDAVRIEKKILKKSVQPQIQSINDFELYGVVCHFLLETGKKMNIDIQDDDRLVESLLTHIKGMHRWKDSDYEWELEDTGTDFEIVKEAAGDNFSILESYLKFCLTSKMKESIIIHICAALLRRKQNISPLKIVVSCPGSMATSKYLEAQIKNYFNFEIAGIMTTQQVKNVGGYFEEADLILSTVPIQESSLPVITVSPLMTITDIQKIQNFAFRKRKKSVKESESKYPVLDKICAIYESGNEENIRYMNQKLEQVLEELVYIEEKNTEQSALLHMLDAKYIRKVRKSIEWRKAIKLAALDLIRDGFFDESYVNEAIGNIEEYGNYVIVNKGIALAHAGKDAGVYEDGISLLVSEDGVVFEGDEKVYLLFVFSQKGDTDYIDLFREIIQLGEKPEDMLRLRKAEGNMQIYKTMKSILVENK